MGLPGADGGWGEGQEGGKRLKWIRGVSIEMGEKGQTPEIGAHRSRLSLHTHTQTHTSSHDPEGGVTSV